MKGWLRLSSLLPLCAAAYTLIAKEGVSQYAPLTYVSYCLTGASALALTHAAAVGGLSIPSIPSVLAGLAVGGAVIAQAIAIDSAPNPGLASSVFRSQSGLTVLAAVALLHGELDGVALSSVAVTLAGVYLATTGQTTTPANKAQQHRHAEYHTHGQAADGGSGWVRAALLAAALMTAKDLLSMLSVRGGITPSGMAAIEITVAAIVTMAYKRIKTGSDINIGMTDEASH